MADTYRLYHAPFVPWMPTEVKEFSSEDAASAWGREHWYGQWVLAPDGSELDILLRQKLALYNAVHPMDPTTES